MTGPIRIAYGDTPTSYGELSIPGGTGPFPVVMLLHGGCWLASLGAMEDYRRMAAALRGDGIATWNVEYSRVGHDHGGWPGTFRDLGGALDYVAVLAGAHPIDLARVVILGHSSGGHFGAWLAARPKLPDGSDIKGAPKVAPAGAVINDAFIDPRVIDSRGVDGELYCGEPIIERLIGGDPSEKTDRMREISPLEWLPWGMPQAYVVSSGRYPVTPYRALAQGRTTLEMPDYPALARASGDPIEVEIVENAGHFDFIHEPGTEGFKAVHRAVVKLADGLSNS